MTAKALSILILAAWILTAWILTLPATGLGQSVDDLLASAQEQMDEDR